MRNLVLGLSLAVALLAGCIIGAAASRLVVPPVRAATNPPKWEYKCFDESKAAKIESKANRLGQVGIELAGALSSGPGRYQSWCFKRRLR